MISGLWLPRHRLGDDQIAVIIDRKPCLAGLLDDCRMPIHFTRIGTANQRNEERIRFITHVSKAAKHADRHTDGISAVQDDLPLRITFKPEHSPLTFHRDEYFLRCMPMQRRSAAFWRPDIDDREAMSRELDLRRKTAVR